MRRHAVLEEPRVSKQDTCPRMQQFIEQLATKHQLDVSVSGVRLWLILPGTSEYLLIAGLSGQRVGLTHCVADADGRLACAMDLVFLVNEVGWQPIELLHSEAVWAAYVQRMAATGGAQVYDEAGEIRLLSFAEDWVRQLTQQHWLEDSQPVLVYVRYHPAAANV